tara:strand:+ start:2513 stop:2851 length:339 start_codon:yes stop_codon:yes gene_type:complete
MKYIRYVFDDEAQAKSKIESFHTVDADGSKTRTVNASFIEIGKFVLSDAILDENDVEVTPAVLSEGWSVDVLWNDLSDTFDEETGDVVTAALSPEGWLGYEVYPVTPMHVLS